jgi:hypothetical protein
MNKKPADIDPRSIAVDFFRKLGGMEGMIKWGKTHRSHAYSLIAKLLAQPLVQNVAVNVINDGEAARRKLEDAFLQLIESRKYEGVDPAAFINGERLEPLTIDHQPLAADPRSATPDPAHQAASDDATSPQKGPFFSRGGVSTTSTETSPGGGQNKNTHYSKPIPSIPGMCAGAAVGEDADDKLSTTEKFLRWNGHGKM